MHQSAEEHAKSWFSRFELLHTGIYISAFVIVVITYIVIKSGRGLHKIMAKALKKWFRNSKEKIYNSCCKKNTTKVEMAPGRKDEEEQLEK